MANPFEDWYAENEHEHKWTFDEMAAMFKCPCGSKVTQTKLYEYIRLFNPSSHSMKYHIKDKLLTLIADHASIEVEHA